jgi:Tol biopolymer transport system component
MNRRNTLAAVALVLAPLAAMLAAAALPKDTTVRLSIGLLAAEANDDCDRVAISGNGRYVAFASAATFLVDGDDNGARDVFLCDTQTLALERVSLDSAGAEADGFSNSPAVSASGRYVAFSSPATNLVAFDGNAQDDVFVRDRKKGVTTRVSVATGGTEGNDESEDAALSASGRFVAFESDASDLVVDDLNGMKDVFVHDAKSGETTRVSVASDGAEADDNSGLPAISANGRWVVFRSDATNLVPNDDNALLDVFLHDRKAGTTVACSADPSGEPQGECAGRVGISANGRYVIFNSEASGLVDDDTNGTEVMDTFVFDRVKGTVERVTLGPGDVQAEDSVGSGGIFSWTVALSGSGRFATFPSAATNLVEGGTTGVQHVYVRDRKKGETLLMSLGPADVQGDNSSPEAALSKSGKVVAFSSDAANLVADDLAGNEDVFVRRW